MPYVPSFVGASYQRNFVKKWVNKKMSTPAGTRLLHLLSGAGLRNRKGRGLINEFMIKR
jgi:hypothetical protein